MKALVPASGRQIAYVRRWFNANPDAIEEQERQFLKNGLDVVPLVSATRSPTMERLKELCPAFITKLFPAKNVSDPEGDSSASGTQYSNDTAVEKLISTTFILVGLGLLFGPMWWLVFVSDTMARLGIITGFVAFFTLAVQWASDIQPWEVLAATTA